jgi:hypothetical protein
MSGISECSRASPTRAISSHSHKSPPNLGDATHPHRAIASCCARKTPIEAGSYVFGLCGCGRTWTSDRDGLVSVLTWRNLSIKLSNIEKRASTPYPARNAMARGGRLSCVESRLKSPITKPASAPKATRASGDGSEKRGKTLLSLFDLKSCG